ncbi:MAG: alpha/beta hydrolase [Spirochaetales bacterium]|nr:alpha/beta hydrolase [Spirochaetales bacterium]
MVKARITMILIVTAMFLSFSACTTPPAADTQNAAPARDNAMNTETDTLEPSVVAGIWQGSVKAGGQELRIVFHFQREENGWAATADSPDQGVEGIPVESVTVDGLKIELNIPAVAGQYKGKFDRTDSVFRGKWHQGGGVFALDLERIEKVEAVIRPQDPVPPFPYDETEVTFTNDEAGITLAGTLTVPRRGGPFPAVILVSGSGAQNRNEELMNHRPFLVLADHLTRQGIAVLRYDDRGVGGSGGDPAAATSEDFADDAYAAFTFLTGRPGIDARRTGIIGHSEGGIIAPMVAARAPEVNFIVLLAGSGVPGKELLLQQSAAILRASGAPEAQINAASAVNKSIYDVIISQPDNEKAAEQIQEILGGLGIPQDQMDAQITAMLSPWYRYFLTYDPATSLKNTGCPVLALNGSLDLQVPADQNLAAIEQALNGGGNAQVTTIKLEGLNHLFQHATTGLVQEYAQIEETFAPEALQTISDWILETAR